MVNNICGFAVLLFSAILVALIVLSLVRRSLSALLDEVAKMPACTTFYVRLLTVGLILIALSSTFGNQFNLAANAHLMDYVWKVASGLSSVFGLTCLFLTGYLFVVTVLVAVLRRKQ